IYGENSRQYQRLSDAASLDATSYVLSLSPFGNGRGGTPVSEICEGGDRGRNTAISILQGEVDAIKEDLQFSPGAALPLAPIVKPESSDDIFILLGHDEAAKETLARVRSRAGLKPRTVHGQPSGRQPIIDKLGKQAYAVGFAVGIATPAE